MSEFKTQRLSESVRFHTFTDPRFKTTKVSVDLLVPLSSSTAATYGILPSLVSRATRTYPDYTALNARLAELYGASLNNSVRKMGEYQVLSLSAAGIASRYAFGGEDMFAQLTGLLFDIFFDPLKDQDGLFPADGFEQEQRQILEMKDSEFNDKITYAHQRSEEFLFQGQNAGVNRYGSREDVAALNRKEVTEAWQQLLSQAQFEIFALGDCLPNPEVFQTRFSSLGTSQKTGMLAVDAPGKVRRKTEEQPLSQSKLSMTYRVDFSPEEQTLYRLMAAALGGTPSSKLFQNVREKMGLCYYCSAGLNVNSRTLYVESGVETENLTKAESTIAQQLEALQQGDLSEEELLSAKLALKNSLCSVGDSLSAVENWYLGRCFSGKIESPEEAVDQLMSYTKEQVVEAARKLHPTTVYSLKGSGSQR